MVEWECGCLEGVPMLDGKPAYPLPLQAVRHIEFRRLRERQFSQSQHDTNFPRTCCRR